MKVNDEFILQEIADEGIVVPVGKASDSLQGVVKLNSTGVFLWKIMLKDDHNEESLSSSLAKEYSISKEKAQIDVEHFFFFLRNIGCIVD